jgi:hypothetical protein
MNLKGIEEKSGEIWKGFGKWEGKRVFPFILREFEITQKGIWEEMKEILGRNSKRDWAKRGKDFSFCDLMNLDHGVLGEVKRKFMGYPKGNQGELLWICALRPKTQNQLKNRHTPTNNSTWMQWFISGLDTS